MGIRWKDFEIPKKLTVEEGSLTETYGKFTAEPLERGFGTTFGNSLRRMLLSSIEGAAVIAVKIDGVDHEFSRIPEVLEDTPQILLNIRNLILSMDGRSNKVITIDVEKEGAVTAGDISTDGSVHVLNPELYLFSLNSKKRIYMELTVAKGRGFVTAEDNKGEGLPIGVIPIDAVFSPITRVNFAVENTRVVQVTDYDKLSIEIFTNGSVAPLDALNQAAAIWRKHLDVFEDVAVEEEVEEEEVIELPSNMDKILSKDISELELSVRSANCLREANIKTIYDLVTKSETEMLKFRNFGKRSLNEINDILQTMNLSLNMNLDGLKGIDDDDMSVDIADDMDEMSEEVNSEQGLE